MSMKTNRSSSPTRIDVPVAGGSLAAFWLGPRDERVAPVLAVHGITSNSRAWVAVARRLEADRHAAVDAAARGVALLAVDLRGRGASNQLPAPYGLAAYARDLLAVLDHCEIERAVVAGHSLGAYIT